MRPHRILISVLALSAPMFIGLGRGAVANPPKREAALEQAAQLSPRPGTVRQVFNVPLPRPRVPDHRFTAEFAATCREVKHAMQMNGGGAG